MGVKFFVSLKNSSSAPEYRPPNVGVGIAGLVKILFEIEKLRRSRMAVQAFFQSRESMH